VVKGNQRIERILGNLRVFSQERERVVERTDVVAALEATVELLRPRVTSQKIEVSLRVDARAHVGDHPGELDQVLTNLLLNACQAMPDGGRLGIRCWTDDGHALVSLADSGPGIPQAERAAIFRPFYTTRGPGEGTGLGLSVSSEIVRRNGGTLELAADGSVGATFVVRWPLWIETEAG
jgi:two-component system, NtrC family, sensor kinase